MMRIENKRSEAGFTLVEMAVVILIVGLIVGAFFAFYTPYLEQSRYQTTIERQKKIAAALTDFVQRTGRLPCPARPDGVPLGVEVADCRALPSGTPLNNDGIVPFRTLGLSQEDATDGYYNPFTYAAPFYASTSEANLASYPAYTTVHDNCRVNTGTNPWVVTVPPNPAANVNRKKAIFCCRTSWTDTWPMLRVYSDMPLTNANHIVPIQYGSTNTGTFTSPDTGVSASNTTDEVAYFAYVIVSHGKNGDGSYTFGQNRRKPMQFPGNTAEVENADNYTPGFGGITDMQFVVLPRSDVSGARYFDDIVLWRTQQSMMRELGNDSCTVP